jgi:hypothetical protein
MKSLCTLLLAFVSTIAFGQDYAMFEVHYLRVKPGNEQAATQAITKHNKTYHAEDPYKNTVFSILTGPHTGDLMFAMGPLTFTQLDNRPASSEHNADWLSVQSLCERIEDVQYWTANDELSFTPENADDSPRPLSRTRFFEVEDNGMFRKVQGYNVKTIAALGGTNPRTMYRKRFLSGEDKVTWATVSSYKNWAELDEDNGGDWGKTYKSVNGEEAWNNRGEEWGQAVISRRDEWRMALPELSGASGN